MYATQNEMKLNLRKTKFMMFNACQTIDFLPTLNIEGQAIELVEEIKILGVVISSDLKFSKNTEYMVQRAFKRLWMLRRLKTLGASYAQLIDVYEKQIRSILELAVPAWHSCLTLADKLDIERVQRAALQVIFGPKYSSYSSACELAGLNTLEVRRNKLCKKFAYKAVKHPKHSRWFKVNDHVTNTRQKQPTFCPVISRTSRFDNSPISYMTKLLNKQEP